MDTSVDYTQIVKQVLYDWQEYYQRGGIELSPLFDDQRKKYLLLKIGWYDNKYIHAVPIHLDIINNKIWIQRDETEEGVATDLIEAGVPRDHIVLGFRPPMLRPYTEFAVA